MPVPDFSPGEVLTAAAMDSIGLWKVGEFTASGTSRALVCDNIFTTDFTNYRVIVRLSSTIATNACFYQYLDTSGVSVNTNYYGTAYGQDYAGGTTGFIGTLSLTSVQYVGYVPNSGSAVFLNAALDIYDPRTTTTHTAVNGMQTGISSGAYFHGGAVLGMMNAPQGHRGLRFDNGGGGNLTGKVIVYGYRN
jgi:hypothetical protein